MIAAVLRRFVDPFRDELRPISVRTWIILFGGPTFVFLSLDYPFIKISLAARLVAALPVAAAVVASLLVDYGVIRRRRSAVTIFVIAWMVCLLAASIVSAPKNALHDELLQTETALEGIEQGINPYQRDYTGTLVETWLGNLRHLSWVNGEHPALHHYVYLPGLLVLSLPFHALIHLTGWYDQRIVYLIAFVILLVLAWRALARSPVREPLLLLLVLNPLNRAIFVGLNDLPMLLLLAITGFAIIRRRFLLAAAAYGLALVTKQPAWFTVPFVLPLLVQRVRAAGQSWPRTLGVMAGVALAVALPFVLWSPSAIYDDTIGFFTSGRSYPIIGEGLGELLVQIGIVGRGDPYQFWPFQLIFALPTIIVLALWVRRQPTLQRAFLAASLSLTVVWFFSRYFLLGHVTVITILMMLAFLIGEAERTAEHP